MSTSTKGGLKDLKKKVVLLMRAAEEEEAVDDQYLPSPVLLNLIQAICQLTDKSRRKLFVILKYFPGRTIIAEHDIVLKDAAPVKCMIAGFQSTSWCPLKKEVDLIPSQGIIELSKSEWCSPVVLVSKRISFVLCHLYCFVATILVNTLMTL